MTAGALSQCVAITTCRGSRFDPRFTANAAELDSSARHTAADVGEAVDLEYSDHSSEANEAR